MVVATFPEFCCSCRRTSPAVRIYALLDNVASARFRVRLFEVTGTTDDPLARRLHPAQLTASNLFAIEIGGIHRVRVSIEPMTSRSRSCS